MGEYKKCMDYQNQYYQEVMLAVIQNVQKENKIHEK